MEKPRQRRQSFLDVDFTVPTLEQQLKQGTGAAYDEKRETEAQSVVVPLAPGLEVAPDIGTGVNSPDLANVSQTVRNIIGDVDVKTAVAHAKEGGYLLKYCRNRLKKPHDRFFWVDMETLALRWTSPQRRKKNSDTLMPLTSVDLILPGEDSDFFKKKKKEERALGIELIENRNKLRIVCQTYGDWRLWIRGLLYAHQKAITKRKRSSSLTNEYIRRIWTDADVDQSGSIQFNELIYLLQQLKVQMDLRYAEKLFCYYDDDGSHVLEYDEFKQLLHRLLTHEDVLTYFDHFKNAASRVMTKESYRQFLLEVQHTAPAGLPAELNFMEDMRDPFKKQEGLTDWGFSLLLTSDANSILHVSFRLLHHTATPENAVPGHDTTVA